MALTSHASYGILEHRSSAAREPATARIAATRSSPILPMINGRLFAAVVGADLHASMHLCREEMPEL
jgi:hypothetical protein